MLTADKSRELRSRGLSSRLRVVADTDNVYWVESMSHANEPRAKGEPVMTARIFALALCLIPLPLITAVPAARPCEPDCRVFVVSPYLGPMWVQEEYTACLSDPDAIWFEDGSATGDCNH